MKRGDPLNASCVALASWMLGFASVVAAQAQTISLTIEAAPAATVGEYSASVTVRSPNGLGALEAELVYDDAMLELKDVAAGPLLSEAMLGHKILSPGRVRCDFISNQPIETDGVLFVARFAGRGTGATSLQLENAEAWDHANLHEMRVEMTPGELTLSQASAGSTPGGRGPLIGVVAVVVIVIVYIAGRASKKG